jgi:uncharacterized protein (TIGR02265 family)
MKRAGQTAARQSAQVRARGRFHFHNWPGAESMYAMQDAGVFVEPPWAAPLDVERVLAAVSPSATIAGMFFLAIMEGSQRRQVPLPFARARYLPFGFYPIREFVPLLVLAAQRFYPQQTLREGLRRIGASGPAAFLSSTLGRVTLGSSQGAHATVSAIAKTYSINIRPSRCEVVQSLPHSMRVSFDAVPYFLDSHHVGVLEGTLLYAGVEGSVRICSRSETAADLWLEWR